ncbi:MAG: DUF3343 domain-containing protein [Deltaproteobacteria bacterium]|nr:DUF3343 domain-containing protein [Deltaproteobacteria bacterium]
MKLILTFANTHIVLKAEEVLKNAGLDFRLDPAPKSITTACELVISINDDVFETVIAVLKGADISYDGVYRKRDSDYDKFVT